MTSVLPIDNDQSFSTDAVAAEDRVDASALDVQLANVKNKLNELLTALALVIRDDDTLVDQVVRLRNLHPEILAAIAANDAWLPKISVACASTANLALTGEQTIDGVLTSASRVLVKDQTAGEENGIYVTGAGAWTRATDADAADELGLAAVLVAAGDTLGNTAWVQTVEADDITLDTTALVWAQFSGLSGTLSIAAGGTGATTAAAARLSLGITAAMDAVVTSASLGAARTALGGLTKVVATVAALKALATTDLVGTVMVEGYGAAGDGGGGLFRWASADASTDNGGTIIAPNAGGVGRWNRVEGYRYVFNVREFGAVGDGTTDDTTVLRAAAAAAEAAKGVLYFPPAALGYRTQPIHLETGSVVVRGDNTKMVQVHEAFTGSSGAGSYKASPVFLVKKGADDVTIEGFDFTTDDATFPTPSAGWFSYFASVIVHRADRVTVRGCRFRGGQPRGVFLHGGNYFRLESNHFEGCGVTLHVGFTNNTNFFDAGAVDTTNTFSPIAPLVRGNTFEGYAFADNTNVLFLSGCADFVVDDNRVLNVNNAAATGIEVYTNDAGMTDVAGAAVDRIDGQVVNNIVTGTFANGISITSESSGVATLFKSAIAVTHNEVRGTGIGIRLTDCPDVKVTENHVKVAGSPMYLDKVLDRVAIRANYLEGTAAGTTLTTIYQTTSVICSYLAFEKNHVVSPAADQYSFRVQAGGTLTSPKINDNEWEAASTVASPRVIVATVAGQTECNRNKFTLTGTGFANTYIGTIGGAGSIEFSGNKLVSASSEARGFNLFSFTNLEANHNYVPGFLIEDCTYSAVTFNKVKAGANTTVVAIDIVNGTLAEVHGNWSEIPAAVNQPCIKFAATVKAKCTMNYVIGNSTGSLIQHVTSGSIETIGNTITNNGAGGTAVGVTGTAAETTL